MSPSTAHRRAARGFTLIEVMVVAGIVGMLSSVAFPNYQRMVLRARAAERTTIMTSIADAVNDVLQSTQSVPGGTLVGAWNPPGALGPTRRTFDPSMAGWNRLPIVVQGSTYYSYQFTAVDGGGTGTTTLDVFGEGDLDGDGARDAKHMHYDSSGYSLQLTSEVPPAGMDTGRF